QGVRDLNQRAGATGGRDVAGAHRHVGRAEVDGAGLELLDAGAGADGVVVDRDRRMVVLILVEGGAEELRDEGRAGAGQAAAADVDRRRRGTPSAPTR